MNIFSEFSARPDLAYLLIWSHYGAGEVKGHDPLGLKWGEDTGDKGEASATEAEAPVVTCHPSDRLTALRASECSIEG